MEKITENSTLTKTSPLKTPFYKYHLDAGAKMVEFAGFLMPVQYKGITSEHMAVRQNVGLFDLSHMGEFDISGSGSLSFLQKVTTNNVSKLNVGEIQYSCMTYPDGGIVDDILLYRTDDNSYLMVVNAANLKKDFDWLTSHLDDNAKLVDRSNNFGLLAIQGPKAASLLSELIEYDLGKIGYYNLATGIIAGEEILFSRTGYTGEDGFELYIHPEKCSIIWEAVTKVGHKHGLELIGLGARDTLRLEMKMTLYGNDIDKTKSPIEAGLGWIVDLDKEFIGREALARIKSEKPKRRLICMELEGRMLPRHGYEIFNGESQIGVVTSGTFSPSLKKPIAIGYVDRLKAKSGRAVEIAIRNKRSPAIIVPPPFYKNGSHL